MDRQGERERRRGQKEKEILCVYVCEREKEREREREKEREMRVKMLNLFQNSKAKKRNPYSQLKNGPNYKLTKLQEKIVSPSLLIYIFLYKHFTILHTCIKHANILSRATSIKLIRLNTKALCIFLSSLSPTSSPFSSPQVHLHHLHGCSFKSFKLV